jgi:ABC-2 type transport system permease protein
MSFTGDGTGTPVAALGGAVYDRGYRPYEGARGGRSAARWALWRLTVRRALGLRRSWRQKVLPWSLLALAAIPAIVNVGVRYATRDMLPREIDFEFTTFREYVGVSTMLLLFVAVSAPDALCPDRHDRVLPLIFSRPLTGEDYVAAKVGALFAIIFGFGFLPQVLLFVGEMLVHDAGALEYFTDNAEVLWQVPVAVALLALYYAVVGLALSSLTERRVVGAIALLGLVLVSLVVSETLVATGDGEDGSAAAVLDLLGLPLHLRDLVFLGEMGPDSTLSGVGGGGAMAVCLYVAIVAGGLVVLLARYREVDL